MPRPTPRRRPTSKKTAEVVGEGWQGPDDLVLFFDEARFGAKPEVARQWASRGKRPRAVVLPGYENFFWYAAVAPRGGESFVLELPWVDAEMVSLYLDRLAAAFPGRRILLIWDRAGTHVARGVRVPEHIHLLSLPAYSPELNPVTPAATACSGRSPRSSRRSPPCSVASRRTAWRRSAIVTICHVITRKWYNTPQVGVAGVHPAQVPVIGQAQVVFDKRV